jgi:hypothetical protein
MRFCARVLAAALMAGAIAVAVSLPAFVGGHENARLGPLAPPAVQHQTIRLPALPAVSRQPSSSIARPSQVALTRPVELASAALDQRPAPAVAHRTAGAPHVSRPGPRPTPAPTPAPAPAPPAAPSTAPAIQQPPASTPAPPRDDQTRQLAATPPPPPPAGQPAATDRDDDDDDDQGEDEQDDHDAGRGPAHEDSGDHGHGGGHGSGHDK